MKYCRNGVCGFKVKHAGVTPERSIFRKDGQGGYSNEKFPLSSWNSFLEFDDAQGAEMELFRKHERDDL